MGPHIQKVVRYGCESVACGSTCPRGVVVHMAKGVACGSTCPKSGKIWL